MKNLLLTVLATASLAGCVVAPPAPTIARAPVDPYQWHVVSVEPVYRDAQGNIIENRAAPQRQVQATPAVVYRTEPAPVYLPAPVYAPRIVYPAPIYYDPLWSLLAVGLSFEIGRSWHGHRHHHHGWRGPRRR